MMPFLGPHMTGLMQSAMVSGGMAGPDSIKLATSVSMGTQLGVVGKPFSTQDTGTITGSGPAIGSGMGLTVQPAIVKAAIEAKALSLGLAGSSFPKVSKAASDAFCNEMKMITLMSTHFPVFAGTGSVMAGSIPISDSELKGNIQNQGMGLGFMGESWGKVAQAIAFGFSEGAKAAVGTVTIVGAPLPPPAVPIAGSGSSLSGVLL